MENILREIISVALIEIRGKQRKTRSGGKEPFTILSSSHRKRSFLKVLVPNKNRVEELYRLFPQLPPGERPFNGFTCALHKDILLQGRMIISTNCICFHSNIFGYETRLVIYFKNVLAVRREKTAFVVPNAISVRTVHKRYLFCSFLSRESVYKLILRIWKTSTEDKVESQDLNSQGKRLCSRECTTDVNHNQLTTITSYDSSLGASYGNYMSARPHTSPPSLNSSPQFSYRHLAPDKLYEGIGDITNTDSDGMDEETEPDDGEVFIENSALRRRNFTKSNTLGDLRELAGVSNSIGSKKVDQIGKNMLKRYKIFCLNETSHLQRCYTTASVNIRLMLKVIYQTFNRIRLKNPAVFIMLLLFMCLTFLSLVLLLRVNAATKNLQVEASIPDSTTSDNLRMQDIFHYRDNLHNAKVARMKSILSVNLETVNEVRKALHDLKEKLQ
ncbi:uncharacterized protein LOC130643593 isoform X2 [Hydractinia symbiolongicarpus]|uniref:uncharacterized protein LOC130643593 isoform X2 n=1 Tax=Hydractinia symbiolongicarpus TaxID=13093 RepID=UPI00254BAF5D|nr:uncharacterized protein LOC130643593 isoform X2 [Hydractinia symbiolongicarpus]